MALLFRLPCRRFTHTPHVVIRDEAWKLFPEDELDRHVNESLMYVQISMPTAGVTVLRQTEVAICTYVQY